jgi:hypothetical protein
VTGGGGGPGYVLWTRADTGQAALWRVNPGAGTGTPPVIPVEAALALHAASGVGKPWQATSYAHVSDTEGYVLWTRADTGQAVLWQVDPSAATGTPAVIPVEKAMHLRATSGIGGPWQATSYMLVSSTEGYLLWTRADTGQAALWQIDPGGAAGTPLVIPVKLGMPLRSTSGVGGPWQASGGDVRGPAMGAAGVAPGEGEAAVR